MRQKTAKRLRKMVYGDYSLRTAQYLTHPNGFTKIRNDHAAVYRKLKRIWKATRDWKYIQKFIAR